MHEIFAILKSYHIYGLVALATTMVATALAIRVAQRLGVMDVPDQQLKPHARPTPYLGGVAICLGWTAALLAALLGAAVEWQLMLPILAGGILVSLIGLIDDIAAITPKLRLIACAVIVVIVLLTTKAGFRLLDSLFVPLGVNLPPVISVTGSFVLALFIVLGACNSANLIDGLDGLCSGVTAIVSLGLFALTAFMAMRGYSETGDPVRLVLAISMFGAALGFLPLNFNPARIFMGDAGSMLLGFNCGMMILLLGERAILRWVLGGLMVFALPIADTALALFRRWRSGRSIFAGDRSHFYDQLVDRGMSVKQVVTISYVVAATYAALGCLPIWIRTRYIVPLYVLVALATIVILAALRMTKAEPLPQGKPARRTLNILFTSAGRRVSLIHEFSRAARDLGVDLRIHAADQQPMAPALQIADCSLIAPPVTSTEYIDELLDYCRKHNIDAVIPLIDPELRPLANARDTFAQNGTRVIISSPKVVHTSVDKIRTNEFLRRHDFLTPRILTDEELLSPSFPLFIKPKIGSSSLGAHKINTADDLAYYRGLNPESIVQEFAEGVEYTIDVFADFEGRARCAVPRCRHEVRGGEVSKGQAVRHPRMMQESCRLVDILSACRGVITIQCFLTPAGDIVFIEINPRFGGGVPLSIEAGADSPRWIIELLLDREPDIRLDGWTDGLLMLRYDRGLFVHIDDLPTPPSPHQAPPAVAP